jgi:hypothetical protein
MKHNFLEGCGHGQKIGYTFWTFRGSIYLGIRRWRVQTESQMSRTSTKEANKETAREPARCLQYLSKLLHTLTHGTCLLPFNPKYAILPAVPVAEATSPNINCITTNIYYIYVPYMDYIYI